MAVGENLTIIDVKSRAKADDTGGGVAYYYIIPADGLRGRSINYWTSTAMTTTAAVTDEKWKLIYFVLRTQ